MLWCKPCSQRGKVDCDYITNQPCTACQNSNHESTLHLCTQADPIDWPEGWLRRQMERRMVRDAAGGPLRGNTGMTVEDQRNQHARPFPQQPQNQQPYGAQMPPNTARFGQPRNQVLALPPPPPPPTRNGRRSMHNHSPPPARGDWGQRSPSPPAHAGAPPSYNQQQRTWEGREDRLHLLEMRAARQDTAPPPQHAPPPYTAAPNPPQDFARRPYAAPEAQLAGRPHASAQSRNALDLGPNQYAPPQRPAPMFEARPYGARQYGDPAPVYIAPAYPTRRYGDPVHAPHAPPQRRPSPTRPTLRPNPNARTGLGQTFDCYPNSARNPVQYQPQVPTGDFMDHEGRNAFQRRLTEAGTEAPPRQPTAAQQAPSNAPLRDAPMLKRRRVEDDDEPSGRRVNREDSWPSYPSSDSEVNYPDSDDFPAA
ncbi:unnamed protein product [Zymoseptoria tritici ST99CH_3D7]|uniref:Uncharacterized protein n=1 Tax=Zymoseptoria tritici (strain ST99CH_3D7) TaxID=1276538 RepID=A0A1X7S6H2_ZYMT9|nr:unnamed protein product [Zymoseptoria tritici ST99CH_3D7]